MAKIISLNKCSDFDLSTIGEKAKNLSIISDSFIIPEGFVLPYNFIREALKVSSYNYDCKTIELGKEIIEEIESVYSALNVSNLNDLSQNTENFELVIRPSCYPSKFNEKVPTIINIGSFKDLIRYLGKEMFVFSNEDCKGGIIIQRLVKPKISGIVTICKTKIEIKTNYGFSKSIKQGCYDTIVFDRLSKKIEKKIGEKRIAYVFNKESKNIEQKEVPETKLYNLSISDENISKIIQNALYLNSRGFNQFEFSYYDRMYVISVKKSDNDAQSYEENNTGESDENDDFLDLLSIDLFGESEKGEESQKDSNWHLNIETIEFHNEIEDSARDEKQVSKNREQIIEDIKSAELEAKRLFNLVNKNKKHEFDEIVNVLDSLINKFTTINPALKGPLDLLKEEFIKELKKKND